MITSDHKLTPAMRSKIYREQHKDSPLYKERVRKKSRKEYLKNREGYLKRWRDRKSKFPEKIKANNAVRYAVKSGSLKKLSCEICKNPKTDAHHEDYSKPLDVIWLCRSHHFLIHKLKENICRENFRKFQTLI